MCWGEMKLSTLEKKISVALIKIMRSLLAET
jgi:hypothetical protein